MLDAVVKGLDDVFFKVLGARIRGDDRLAISVGEFRVGDSENIHLDTVGGETASTFEALFERVSALASGPILHVVVLRPRLAMAAVCKDGRGLMENAIVGRLAGSCVFRVWHYDY